LDIVCARCGRHLNSVEACREHSRACRGDPSEPAHFYPASHVTKEDWVQLVSMMLELERKKKSKTQAYVLKGWKAFLVISSVFTLIGLAVWYFATK